MGLVVAGAVSELVLGAEQGQHLDGLKPAPPVTAKRFHTAWNRM
jgi:hypothetical protein